MAVVNISLVGGQPMPVYVGILATKPDKVILVHSSTSKDDADSIKQNCGKPCRLLQMSPVDYNAIVKQTENLLESLNDEDSVVVNVSSGTKLWSIAFSIVAAKYKNAMVFYIDQNSVLHDLTNLEKRVVEPLKSIDTILKYHDQRGYSYTLLNEYDDDDWLVHWKMRDFRKINRYDLTSLTAYMNDDFNIGLQSRLVRRDCLSLRSGSYVEYDKDRNTVELSIVGKCRRNRELLSSPNVMNVVFNSGWFEYEVAKMFDEWEPVNEIWMNVNFPSHDNKEKNEIDIIVNLGTRLLFVECKTHISKITDIDKFNNAVQNYGGTGSIALFVTDDKMTSVALEKCRESNVLVFSLQDAYPDRKGRKKSLEDMWKQRRKLLHGYLNQHLQVINKK